MAKHIKTKSNRLFSLDVFRGITMFLLIAEAAGFHHSFLELAQNTFVEPLAMQLHHHPWNGMRFWDLIQPFFMFIVGVAMPFSISKRLKKDTNSTVTKHIVKRCFLLFLFGVVLHCIYNNILVWELWNVLTQLSFTILIAYGIMNMSHRNQILISVVLLLLTEILYRAYNPSGPYVQHHESFGSLIDMLVMGKVNSGYWVFINFIPTAAHTIWGVICGQVLLSDKHPKEKLKSFIKWGLFILIMGYGLDFFEITPIIKRIATSSFTLASGGYAILTLAFFYWMIDLRGYSRKWMTVFAVVGTNSIFIYLFAETLGVQWVRNFGMIWTKGILGPLGFTELWILLLNSLLVLFFFWYITYFLDKKKVYFKI